MEPELVELENEVDSFNTLILPHSKYYFWDGNNSNKNFISKMKLVNDVFTWATENDNFLINNFDSDNEYLNLDKDIKVLEEVLSVKINQN